MHLFVQCSWHVVLAILLFVIQVSQACARIPCRFVPMRGSLYTTQEEFENAALILRLGLPSILIRHENGTFRT